MAKYFRGLGDPTRVRILELLREHDELSVGELVSKARPVAAEGLESSGVPALVRLRSGPPRAPQRPLPGRRRPRLGAARARSCAAGGQRRARRRLPPHRLGRLLMQDGGGDLDYDLAIVGSGGGAFAAAIAARRDDLRVVMVERGTVGGTCVNVGCIPSKALLAAAGARHRAADQPFPGIATEAGPVDFSALLMGKREIVEGHARRQVRRPGGGVRDRAPRRERAVRRRARRSRSTACASRPLITSSPRAPSRTSPTSPGWPTAAT